MKLFRMLGRGFRDASKSLIRNLSLSLASIVNVSITLILLGSFLIVSLNVNNFAKEIKGDVSVVVFIDSTVPSKRVTEIGQTIKGLSNIKSISFESKEEVKAKLQSESEVFNSIMSGWTPTDNPLYDTYNIKVKSVENVSKTAKAIQEIEGVKLVEYGENFVTKLLSMFKTIEKIGLITILFLVIVTASLIVNTIKLTITARKNEINIMRLVGASNVTIKLPFIIEGLFLGILGAIIPVIFVIYGYIKIYSSSGGTFFTPIIELIKPEPFVYQISLILLLMGMFVGMWGSYRAVRKYLKV